VSTTDNPRLSDLLSQIRDPALTSDAWSRLHWLSRAAEADVERLLAALLECPTARIPWREGLLAEVFRQLCLWSRQAAGRGWSAANRDQIVRLYGALGPAHPSRSQLLQMLAATLQAEDLAAFTALLVEDPPRDRNGVGLALGPLFQTKNYDPAPLFPRLLDAVRHSSVAAAIIDLCNYLTREKLMAEHPATPRKGQLIELLGELVQRLARLGETTDVADQRLPEVALQIEESVSLTVALCDACALLGDKNAIGKLHQALDLPHRRLRTEAAAALARFDEEVGREVLTALAAEPSCRLRVLAYAEELGLLDRVELQFQTPVARAEAELALWLAQPTQIGFPPVRLELFDERSQYWPGFADPVGCFLFRFVYPFPAGDYSNLGIAGPLTHAFSADLADLSPDDIYAAFAGWQAEHEDIFERDVEVLTDSDRIDVVRLERRLRDAGYEGIQSLQLGSFFGEKMLIARAVRDGQAGIAVADPQDVLWFSSAGKSRPLGGTEACCIYKGRKLLRSFNA